MAGLFDKKATETGSTRSVFLMVHLFNPLMVVALIVLLPFLYGEWNLPAGALVWEGLNAVSAVVALLAYYYAMRMSQASFLIGITAGYPIVSQLFAVPLLGETLSASRLLAAILVSAGVALIASTSSKDEGKGLAVREKLSLVACIVTVIVLWALLGIFEKQSLEYARPLECYLALSIWKSLLVFLAVAWCQSRRLTVEWRNMKAWKFSWISAALVAAGNLGFVLALVNTPASYMIVATAGYPLLMYLGALFFLKERFSIVRSLGILLIVAGAVAAEASLF
ncbi:MAG: EamA family transporter [Bryobacteraceae bacterium]|nr:EamA family transporter [Bryobacteraceae bacterium]